MLITLQGILCAHDAIAQKDYYPHLPEVPPDSDDNEETVKIVQLVKSDEPLVRVYLLFISHMRYATSRNTRFNIR